MDTTALTAARQHAEQVEADARRSIAEAHARYGAAVRDLVEEHGATHVAQELGISRGRVYQLMSKATVDD